MDITLKASGLKTLRRFTRSVSRWKSVGSEEVKVSGLKTRHRITQCVLRLNAGAKRSDAKAVSGLQTRHQLPIRFPYNVKSLSKEFCPNDRMLHLNEYNPMVLNRNFFLLGCHEYISASVKAFFL